MRCGPRAPASAVPTRLLADQPVGRRAAGPSESGCEAVFESPRHGTAIATTCRTASSGANHHKRSSNHRPPPCRDRMTPPQERFNSLSARIGIESICAPLHARARWDQAESGSCVPRTDQPQRLIVGATAKVLVENAMKLRAVRRGPGKQGGRRSQLHVIGGSEDVDRRSTVNR